ncbi:hypothetical protein A5657_12365 [Mycobacterium kubicae]|nr:hypothetical protein A5657_12365 [Mycobacterium kubicae]
MKVSNDGNSNRFSSCVQPRHGTTAAAAACGSTAALAGVEPMTGIEPAYSAWEVDLVRPGLDLVAHRSE